MRPGLFRFHRPRFHENNGRNDLQTVGDPVLQFLEQHILLSQQRVRLSQKVLPFTFPGALLADIFDACFR
jgi:hypothetical protein